MKESLALLPGVFSVMALSNAIVPVLPSFAPGTALQGAVFSAYFLGAFLFVLPSGYLADRVGAVPLVRAGLSLTLLSGIVLSAAGSPLLVLAGRLAEGIGAGLFVPAALARLNARPDHERMSGYFMGLLNLGLLSGLLVTGWLVSAGGGPREGIVLFTWVSLLPLALSLGMGEGKGSPGNGGEPAGETRERLAWALRTYFWLWFSAVVLVGITGALTALHPEHSGLSAGPVSAQIALMNIATVASVLVTSHASLPPVPTIRAASIAMAGGVALTFFSMWGFLVIGWLAGMVMIAQLSFLAAAGRRQGVLMGLFNTASYGGMSAVPFLAGITAELAGFPAAYFLTALSALTVAATIGRCECRRPAVPA
ncbi:MAG: MFS transporter [Methanolinea sp.]|nr:MFS transporter [Methanolinea sp.]